MENVLETNIVRDPYTPKIQYAKIFKTSIGKYWIEHNVLNKIDTLSGDYLTSRTCLKRISPKEYHKIVDWSKKVMQKEGEEEKSNA